MVSICSAFDVSLTKSLIEKLWKDVQAMQWSEDDPMMLRRVQDQHVAQVIDQVDDQAQVYEGKH